jgi:hypothetical protein
MHHVSDHAPWRANFIGALGLLGQAVMRQPYGVPDPVLCGDSAVELYTGGLCTADCLEVFAADARSLTAELFAAGFRWTQRTRRMGRGLWHADLQIGMDIIEVAAPRGLADLSNELTVAIDLGCTGLADGAMVSLKVIGIEDLIVEELTRGLMRQAPSREVSARVRELVGLGRAGVAGRLRAGYLQRRVAWVSNGEVAFEASLLEEGVDGDAVPRLVTLSQMRTLISAWWAKRGYSFDQPRVHPACRPMGVSAIRQQNAGWGRAGGLVPANVILLDDVQWTLPE